jgi:hypothetical protein
MKEIVKKYKKAYKVQITSTTYGDTTYTDEKLIYTGLNENEDFWNFVHILISNDLLEISDIMPDFYDDQGLKQERLFLQYLVYRREIDKNEIEDFRKAMFSYLSARHPQQIITIILVVVFIVFIIVGSLI